MDVTFGKAIYRLKHIFKKILSDDGVDTQSGTKKEDLNDKDKKDEEESPAPAFRSKSILESWVWGQQPGGPLRLGAGERELALTLQVP